MNPTFVEYLMNYPMNWTRMEDGDGKKEENRSGEVLPKLREDSKPKEIRKRMGRYGGFSEEEILQSEMYGKSLREGEPREEFNQVPISSETIMRELRHYRESLRSSQRWELEQQPSVQLDDAVQFLSYVLASCSGRHHQEERKAAVLRLRETILQTWTLLYPPYAPEETWESLSEDEKDWSIVAALRGQWHSEWPGVPRVATGVKGRVDRLKGLGNAIVPQIAELIFRQLKAGGDR
ncbi:MAG: hypothetical protein LLG08_00550 [Actinomycetia bacterium]|nr:hypothetical protein [Actinomycetes bacterium]